MAKPFVRKRLNRTLRLPDGRRMHALVWEGRGAPLVILHGLLDSAEGWTELCEATQRPCVAFDLSGFGASDMPLRPSLGAYAEDVIAGLDALGMRNVVIVGHSLGGGVAAAVAERIPRRVLSLVLLAPAGFGRIPLAELISLPGVRNVTEGLLPLALRSRVALSTAYRVVVANGMEPTDEILDRVLDRRQTLAPAAREATKAVVRAGTARHGLHHHKIDYDGPVEVVWGTEDRLVPIGHMKGVLTAFPQAQAHVWEGVGHHHLKERPQELTALVENACRACDPPAERRRVAA